jgi:hypothetical protein
VRRFTEQRSCIKNLPASNPKKAKQIKN